MLDIWEICGSAANDTILCVRTLVDVSSCAGPGSCISSCIVGSLVAACTSGEFFSMECRFTGGPLEDDGSLELSVSPSELASSPESASECALPLPLPVSSLPFVISGSSHVGSSGSPSSCETLNLMCEEDRLTLVPVIGFKFLLARFFAEWDLLSLTRWPLDLFLLPTTW